MPVCSTCKIKKENSEFYRSKNKSNGLTSQCKVCISDGVKRYAQTEKGKKIRKESIKRYKKNHPDRVRKQENKRRKDRRLQVLEHYSCSPPKCVMCGFDDIRALQIDHINGNGRDHRRQLGRRAGGSDIIIDFIIKNNYPDGFQILCANCNMIKVIENKEYRSPNKKYFEPI